MNYVISLLFGVPGAFLTNYLLRDSLGALRIALAVGAGVFLDFVLGAIAVVILAGTTRLDFSSLAILGAIGGPLATAAAVWRWRPKAHAEGDLRR